MKIKQKIITALIVTIIGFVFVVTNTNTAFALSEDELQNILDNPYGGITTSGEKLTKDKLQDILNNPYSGSKTIKDLSKKELDDILRGTNTTNDSDKLTIEKFKSIINKVAPDYTFDINRPTDESDQGLTSNNTSNNNQTSTNTENKTSNNTTANNSNNTAVNGICNKGFLGFPAWYDGLVKTDGTCDIAFPDGDEIGLGNFIWRIALNILQMAIVGAAYVSAGFIMYGGYRYLKGLGSPDSISTGKTIITNAVIGLIFSIIAIGAVKLIINGLKLNI